jgi:hypothetical protein
MSCTEPGSACETHSGNPLGAITAWMLPPRVWALPEYHRSMTSPFTLTTGSLRRSHGMTLPSRITCENPWPLARSAVGCEPASAAGRVAEAGCKEVWDSVEPRG